jgi:hypothetical protein
VIDFRYHLVSIVSVFLALGIGLLLGSTVLKPYVQRTLENTSRLEKAQIDHLQSVQSQLQAQLARDQAWAQANAPVVLARLLAGQRVVLVTAPGAPGQVTSGVARTLRQDAGAVITGQVRLAPSFLDGSPGTRTELAALAQRLAPPGTVVNPQLSPVAQAGQVLASAILTRNRAGQPVAGQPDPASAAVLRGFAVRGFLAVVSGIPSAHATLAVVIIPGTPPAPHGPATASQALVTLAQELQQAGQGTVVAGTVSGSGPGSAIAVMRTGGRAGTMSSVDDADYPVGQIVLAQALYEQLKGVKGSYGVTPTATAAGPVPAPSAFPAATLGGAATPAASQTPARAGGR